MNQQNQSRLRRPRCPRHSVAVSFILTLVCAAVHPALAQTPPLPYLCDTGATPTIVRAEGATELVGDLVITCSGGIPASPGGAVDVMNIQVFLNTNITSRLRTVSGSTRSEILLLVDEPGSSLAGSGVPLVCASSAGCPIVGTGDGAGTYSGIAGRPNIFQGVH